MSDTINLAKGTNINLSKAAGGQTKFVLGLGWNPNPNNPPDLDASIFPCHRDANGDPKLIMRAPAQESFCFYANKDYGKGAIIHSGDNLTGDGDGDDERIFVDTAKLASDIDELIAAVTIHNARSLNQNFGLVRSAYVRIYDAAALEAAEGRAWNAKPTAPDGTPQGRNLSNAELKAAALANYDLEEDAGGYNALQFGTLYQKDGEWRFKALGVGVDATLEDFIKMLAPNVSVTN